MSSVVVGIRCGSLRGNNAAAGDRGYESRGQKDPFHDSSPV
jgi:hypothetical protein